MSTELEAIRVRCRWPVASRARRLLPARLLHVDAWAWTLHSSGAAQRTVARRLACY